MKDEKAHLREDILDSRINYSILFKDKNGSKGPAFCDKNFAKITLGIKIIWKFISEDVKENLF